MLEGATRERPVGNAGWSFRRLAGVDVSCKAPTEEGQVKHHCPSPADKRNGEVETVVVPARVPWSSRRISSRKRKSVAVLHRVPQKGM